MQPRKRPPPQPFTPRRELRPIAASRANAPRAYAMVISALLLGAPLAACTESFTTRTAGSIQPVTPSTEPSVDELPTDQPPGTSPTTSTTPTLYPTDVPMPGGAVPVSAEDLSVLKPSCPLKKTPKTD